MASAQLVTQIDELSIISEAKYDFNGKKEYMDCFNEFQANNVIQSAYDDSKWCLYNGVQKTTINFSFDVIAYKKHLGRELEISPAIMTDMMKCFVISMLNTFVITHSKMIMNGIKKILTQFEEDDFIIPERQMAGVNCFFDFINLSYEEKRHINLLTNVGTLNKKDPRTLKNLINYVAIDDKITKMYADPELSDEDFIKWFPVYFWCKITFIIPLRVTEITLTPFDCIEKKEGKLFITIRRSMQKKKNSQVKHNVEDDYKKFTYHFPYNETIKNIEKYQKLTADKKRPYLFTFNDAIPNQKSFALSTYTDLLNRFVDKVLSIDDSYEFAKQIAGIENFSHVRPGDSRHIAMSNLYYQDAGAEICRQLADHIDLTTSEGYYQNVSNTIQAASIMKFQNLINRSRNILTMYENTSPAVIDSTIADEKGCSSPFQPYETGDIEDCIRENHLESCFGCRFYTPPEAELNDAIKFRTAELDQASLEIINCLNDKNLQSADGMSELEDVYLNAHTRAVRCREAFDEKIKKEAVKWQRHRPIVKTC